MPTPRLQKPFPRKLYSVLSPVALLLIFSGELSGQSTNTMIVDWGDNTFGQLFQPFLNMNVTAVSTGYEHSLAIVDGNSVIAWGDNTYGQLSVPHSSISNPVAVSVGLGHSVVLLGDGTVVAWGFNDYGQTEVGALTDIVGIAAGDEHTLALRSDGTVVVVADPTKTTYDHHTVAATLTNVAAIATGSFHNLALLNDGTVVSWGANEFGQSNVPAGLSNVAAIDAGHFHSLALLQNGNLVGWGDNVLYKQITIPAGIGAVSAISVGSYHNLALESGDVLTGWGSNRFTESEIPAVLQGRGINIFTAGYAHNTAIVQNNAPTEIIIDDPLLVPESTAVNSDLWTFDTTDPDAVDVHVHRLVAGTGDDDNTSFGIYQLVATSGVHDDLVWGSVVDMDVLRNSITFDYETDSLYYIRVEATDLGGLTIQKQVVIKIVDENDPIIALNLSNNTIEEQQPTGTLVGVFSTVDEDLYDSHTYSLVAGDGSEDNSSFTISGDQLLSNEVFDADERSVYLIRVRTTDSGGRIFERQFSIKVLPANEAPTDILLSNNEVPENAQSGSLIGFFSTNDPDANDSHSYTLVSGQGSDDNASFTIISGVLLTNASFNYATKNQYFIRVRSTDNGSPTNLFIEKAFVIQIVPANLLPALQDQTFSVREDAPGGNQVGTIAATDDGTLQFTVVSGNTGSAFSVDSQTGLLTVNSPPVLDYHATSAYSLLVAVEDAYGETAEAVITITVIEVKEPPAAEDQSFEIAEGSPNDTVVGTFVASSRRNNPLLFAITGGDTEGVFSITPNSGQITVVNGVLLNAVRKPLYVLDIRVTDEAEEASIVARAYISLININHAPTAIYIDNQSIPELQPANMEVGRLSTADPDPEDNHSYSLVSGTGDSGNASFYISGNRLLSIRIFEYHVNQNFSVRIRSTDSGSPPAYMEEVFVIDVEQLLLPVIPTAITPNGDGENDRWDIPHLEHFPRSTVEVFDRHGQPVFRSEGYSKPWDGTYQGRLLPVASYYYVIKLNNPAGTSYSGLVSILK